MKQFLLVILFVLLGNFLFTPFASAQEAEINESEKKGASGSFAKWIESAYDSLEQLGKVANQLDDEALANLPILIGGNDVGVGNQMIMIDSARFTPQGAFFNAYILLELPFISKRIAFAAKNVAFNPAGLSQSTGTRLVILQSEKIKINDKVDFVLPAEGGRNYVEWDCNGFKAVNLKGAFEFSREVLVPETADGQVDNSGKVQATFEVNTTDPGAILTTINISPFQVPKLKGFSFQVHEAVVDYNDLVNHAGMQFPKDYQSGLGEDMALWQGFYLKNATIRLPEELSSAGGRKAISVHHMLIDDFGFSAAFYAENLFEDGSMNGWPFSITSMGVTLIKNQLKGAEFDGTIQVPMFDPDSPMKYTARIIHEGGRTNYDFLVQPGSDLKASVLTAKIRLEGNSVIRIKSNAGELQAEAILHGDASLDDGRKVNVKGLRFQNLHLATAKPFIRSGIWSLEGNGEKKLANFPVTINNIQFLHTERNLALKMDVGLNLMGDSTGFGASTRLAILGKIVEKRESSGDGIAEKVRQQWEYERTEVDDILVNVKGGAYEIEGVLSLYDKDPVYGDGFRGKVRAGFAKKVEVEAIAQFGNIEGMRYWYVDAKAMMPNGIGSPIAFYGFGGGLWYRMSPEHFSEIDLNKNPSLAGMDRIGGTPSGVVYKPDPDAGIGFKATVIIGTGGDPTPFNADASFEMTFNRGGGVRYIAFRGKAYFMAEINNRSAKAPVFAELNMSYDLTNEVFHATLATYVNTPALRGSHANGLAGQAVAHFAPDEWYIHIGTPEQRIGLNFIGVAKTGGYIMIGDRIPGFPEPPAEVSDILGGMDLDMMRDENKLGDGSGFAFGASMEVNTGRKTVGIFYGQFGAGLGFDIMLKNYGNARCKGSSGPIGINGWYASGQAWAYLQGQIGIKVKLFGKRREFDILSIGAAAVLQAKLPNPAWMRGVVGGRFSILGGLVKGRCRFKVTIGKECEIVGVSAVTGVKVISEMTPKPEAKEIDVFTAPQVAFNVPINKGFELLNNDNEYKAYRVKLTHFRLMDGGKEIVGEVQWNESQDVAIFKAHEILPPNRKLKAEVKVVWEEKVGSTWRPVGGNNQEYEEESTHFVTGEAPKNIPEENIRYAYPAKGQYNLLKKESPEGYIKLDYGQSYLFETKDKRGMEWKYVARMESPDVPQPIDLPLTYSTSNASLHFEIPAQLQLETGYDLYILKLPAKEAVAIDANVSTEEQEVYTQDSSQVQVTSKSLTGTLSLPDDFLLYRSRFRTSKYNTFAEKLNAVQMHRSLAVVIEGYNLLKLGYAFDAEEVLDQNDLYGWKEGKPLVQLTALPDNPWFKEFSLPVIYQGYPLGGSLKIEDWREAEVEGVPPYKAMTIYQENRQLQLDAGHSMSYTVPGTVYFNYDLEYYTLMDYNELVNKAWGKYKNSYGTASERIRKLLDTSFVNLYPREQYRFKLSYVLPGINKVTTERVYTIEN
ncbi:hypothetical protein AAG747_28455 [Rapidithrix thailandica]|uniref:Uncharacterized protein n=1 Tax=Rapidithrix thailandica TaxID=413964 RepID=A0AAW9S6J8_9BACT